MEGAGWAGARGRWGLGAGPDGRAGAGFSPMAASRFFSMETRMLISLSRCCTCVQTGTQSEVSVATAGPRTQFYPWNLETSEPRGLGILESLDIQVL